MFIDRTQAGRLLAARLKEFRGQDTMVLGLPRGGVIVALEVARALRAPLDIVVTRKIGAQWNPEFAVCAVDAEGNVLYNDHAPHYLDQAWLDRELTNQTNEASRRLTAYRGRRKAISLENKTVLIIDDGIATGLTVRLAVHVVKKQHPARIVVAVPVIPEDVVSDLIREGAEVVSLEVPRQYVGAVSGYYESFNQVSDEEVCAALKMLRSARQ